MDEFLIELQVKLDEAKSKGNINSDINKIQQQIDKLKLQAEIDPKALTNIAKQLESILGQKITIPNINVDSSSVQKVGQQIGQNIVDATQKTLDSKKINTDKLNADIKTLTNNLNTFASKNAGFKDFKTDINGVEVSLDSLISKLSKVDNTADLSTIRSQANALKSTFTELQGASTLQVEQTIMRLNNQLINNSKYSQDAKAQIHAWISELQKGSVVESRLKQINLEAKQLHSTMVNMNQAGQGFFTTLGSKLGTLSTYLSAGVLFQKTLRQVKEAIEFSLEMDDALTNVNYTMDVTASQLEKIGQRSLSMAKDLKTSAANVLDAVKLYANANETAESILQKAQAAIMLSNVTGFSGEQSAKYLQTIKNQFDLAEDELMNISDIVQAVSQNISHDFSDGILQINDAISASGEVARAAGLDLAEYASMIGLLVERTGNAGSQLGNSLKTIITRTTKASEIFGIDEGDISDAEKALRNVGVAVRETDGEFRDFNDTMRDLAKVWDSGLSDVEKSNIAFALAGTRQINVIQSLLRGWTEYEDLVVKANESVGVTLENQEKYAQSLQGRMEELSTTMTSVKNNLINEQSVSPILNVVTKLAQGLDLLTSKLGLLGSLITSTGLFAGIKNKGIFRTNADGSLTNIFKELKTVQTSFEDLDKTTLRSVIKAFNNTSLSVDDLSKRFGGLDSSVVTYLNSTEKGKATMDGLSKSINNSASSMAAATVKANLFSVALNALTGLAISLAIKGITWAIDELVVTLDEQKEKLDDAVRAYEESRTELENINSELETTASRIDELNGKENLTFTEQDELDRLIKTNDELERKIYLLEQANKEAEKEVATEAQNTYNKYTNDRNLNSVEQIDFYTNSSLLEGVTWENFKDDLPWLIAQYKKQQEILVNAQAEGWETIEEQSRKNLELLEGYMSDASLDYQDLYDKISGLSDFAMTDELELAKQDLDDILDIVADILGYGGQRSETSFDDIWNSEDFAKYKAELESLAREGKLDASVLESNEQYRVLLEKTGATADNTAEHIRALVDEMDQVGEGASGQPLKLFDQLELSKDSIDGFKSSVKEAADAYTTLLSGNYSSSELLDSIQTINQAVTDMGGSLNWEFINAQSTIDDLELLGNALELISEKYANSILSGAGIDVDSEFGQMLKNIIQEMFEAEAEFEAMNSQLDNLQSSYQTLTGILESYNKTGYITLDNLQALVSADENLIQMLQVENGQLVLNQAAYENLVAVQLLEFKAKLDDAAAAEIETLAKQKAEQATNSNAQASENAVAKLDAETAAFNRNTSAAIANAVAKAEEAGVSESEIQGVLDKYTEVWQSTLDNYNVNFDSFMSGGTKSAGKAAKKAADEYVKKFEEELKELQTLRDQGKITEKQYLDQLRVLYRRYFADRKKYLKEYQQYEYEYLSGMKSLYEKALSGITGLLDKQISSYQNAKDKEVKSIEETRDAALDAIKAEQKARVKALEDQKKILEKQVKQKEKAIKSIQSEIQAMRDANSERQRELDLQDALFRQRQAENNRNKLVYNSEKGFTWETDTDAIRDARQDVEQAQFEIEIANKEKQISLIEQEVDLLEEQISLIDDQISQINDYYSELIENTEKMYDQMVKDTEKYWDNLIEGMQNYRDRWSELADLIENAELISILEQLGITTEDVLNMSGEAFEKFKGEYVGILADLYRDNDSMTNALAQSLGTTTDKLGSYIDATQEYIDSLSGSADSLQPVSETIDEVSDSMDNLSGSSSGAVDSTGKVASNMGDLSTNTDGLSDNLNGISNALDSIPEADKFNAIADAFSNLGDAIQDVSNALGVGADGTVGGLVGALQSINDISLGADDEEGIIAQFHKLKSAIDETTNAISGGGSSGGQGGDASASSSASMSAGAGGESTGSADSLTGAINSLGTTASEIIGEPDAEGDGTVIGEFGSLKTAVDNVSEAIGIGGEDGSGSGSGGQDEDGTLIGSINDLGTTSYETLGESGGDGVIGRFEEFSGVIAEAEEHVQGINKGLDEIDGKEVECTITINVKQNGSASGLGMVTGSAMNLNSATYNAKLEGASHLEGTALVQGNWAVQSEEQNALLAEIGPEIVVRNGRYHVIGLNGAEMFHIKPGDIVFNAEQSAALLKYGKISGRGKAYADGTVGDKFASGVLRPLQPGDHMWDLIKKAEDYMAQTGEDIRELLSPVNAINRDMERMTQSINTISNIDNSNRIQNVTNEFHISLPNITDSTSADVLFRDLQSLGTKKMQFFD